MLTKVRQCRTCTFSILFALIKKQTSFKHALINLLTHQTHLRRVVLRMRYVHAYASVVLRTALDERCVGAAQLVQRVLYQARQHTAFGDFITEIKIGIRRQIKYKYTNNIRCVLYKLRTAGTILEKRILRCFGRMRNTIHYLNFEG